MPAVFPINGDIDSGENFSTWSSRTNITSYVEHGLNVNVDWTQLTATLQPGYAFVRHNHLDKVVAVNNSDNLSVSFTTGSDNVAHAYLDVNFQEDNAVELRVFDRDTSPEGASLKIATIHEDTEDVEPKCQKPTIEGRVAYLDDTRVGEELTVGSQATLYYGDSKDIETKFNEGDDKYHIKDNNDNKLFNVQKGSADVATYGDVLVDGTTSLWDNTGGHVPQGRLENASVSVNTGAGLAGGGEVALGSTITIENTRDNGYQGDTHLFVNSGNNLLGGGRVELGGNTELSLDYTSLVQQLDDEYLQLTGGTMRGPIDTNNNAVGGLPDPDGPNESVPLGYADDRYLKVDASNDPVTGTLTVNDKIEGELIEAPVLNMLNGGNGIKFEFSNGISRLTPRFNDGLSSGNQLYHDHGASEWGFDTDVSMNQRNFKNVKRIGGSQIDNQEMAYGLSFEGGAGPGVYISDRTFPPGERALIQRPYKSGPTVNPYNVLSIGNRNVPFVHIQSDVLSGIKVIQMQQDSGIVIRDQNRNTVMEVSAGGDINITGNINQNANL